MERTGGRSRGQAVDAGEESAPRPGSGGASVPCWRHPCPTQVWPHCGSQGPPCESRAWWSWVCWARVGLKGPVQGGAGGRAGVESEEKTFSRRGVGQEWASQ